MDIALANNILWARTVARSRSRDTLPEELKSPRVGRVLSVLGFPSDEEFDIRNDPSRGLGRGTYD